MTRTQIKHEYFEWLYANVCNNQYSKRLSYRKLLVHLHNTEFIYSLPMDANRAEDGMDLRYRFALQTYGYDNKVDYILQLLHGPCSVLEMMLALAIRCEESIMDDPTVGDRTGQWFWGMVTNLGLGTMSDDRFDTIRVRDALDVFLNREYEPDGKGGLFTIRRCDRDLRTVEIWHQLCWYLDSIYGGL